MADPIQSVPVPRWHRHGHSGITSADQTPEYRSWRAMNERCHNPKHKDYKYYGGRGVQICERWQSFAAFLADMGLKPSPKHTIDRINSNGNYEPSNCRWATIQQQLENRRKRKPQMRRATHQPEWAELTHGALSNWPDSIPSQYRHQIARIECIHCTFRIEPASLRRYDPDRLEHPQPYGNLASISHARKLMREHIREEHSYGGDTCRQMRMT